jgi:hypothetical protein
MGAPVPVGESTASEADSLRRASSKRPLEPDMELEEMDVVVVLDDLRWRWERVLADVAAP